MHITQTHHPKHPNLINLIKLPKHKKGLCNAQPFNSSLVNGFIGER